MKAPVFVLAVLALIFVACGAPQPQPAQQADQAIVYATPKPAVASGYDWTVERAQDILEGYGFTLEGTDYRGTSDCNVQACMGYFKGSAPVMVHVQLFIERDTLQGIVAAAWNSPSDSMLESLGFAAYDTCWYLCSNCTRVTSFPASGRRAHAWSGSRARKWSPSDEHRGRCCNRRQSWYYCNQPWENCNV